MPWGFNPFTGKLQYNELPSGVKFSRSGSTVTMTIDGQTSQQWIKEVTAIEGMDGTAIEGMDGTTLEGMG